MPTRQRKRGQKLPKLSTTHRRMYAQEFMELVIIHAFKHGVTEAADYYDMPVSTIRQWKDAAQSLNEQAAGRPATTNNPYRGTRYTIERRLSLSDKLFAELEHTAEIEKLKNGYIPADILTRLIQGYSMLTDKRRLEEGAHTALVAEVKDPEEIYREGEAKVLQFRERHLPELPAGKPQTQT